MTGQGLRSFRKKISIHDFADSARDRAPFFKGGDKQRSIQVLEQCRARYPDTLPE